MITVMNPESEPPMLLDIIDHYPERMALAAGSPRFSFSQLGERAVEVEAVLLLHPAVQDACVFGRDDPEWGSCVHALVEIPGEVAGEDATIEQLRQLLEQNLAGFKHPQSLVITASIPRNAAGKVPQSALE